MSHEISYLVVGYNKEDGEIKELIPEAPDLTTNSEDIPTNYATEETSINTTPASNTEAKWSKKHAPTQRLRES